ncbi:MAG: hypothetical protein IJJ47_11385 [Methanosphaera sp.]|nr:hypothetical protein [Methanosphaera sp.]
MVCEINYNHEMLLSDFIKTLYEFENIDALVECVNTLKEEKTLDEVKKMSEEEMFKYFLAAENKVNQK